ncbi:hypothetical protein FACS1894166_07680 [Bacilli bacterium]|nr:hypothetical protein FACS1894166_07680 [Bacilli bacterium]
MKKNDKLQSKSELNKKEIVIDYNKHMPAYQVRVEHREGKDHLIVCAARIGKHKMTIDELAVEMRAGFARIDDRLDRNNLKP